MPQGKVRSLSKNSNFNLSNLFAIIVFNLVLADLEFNHFKNCVFIVSIISKATQDTVDRILNRQDIFCMYS